MRENVISAAKVHAATTKSSLSAAAAEYSNKAPKARPKTAKSVRSPNALQFNSASINPPAKSATAQVGSAPEIAIAPNAAPAAKSRQASRTFCGPNASISPPGENPPMRAPPESGAAGGGHALAELHRPPPPGPPRSLAGEAGPPELRSPSSACRGVRKEDRSRGAR